MRAVAWSVLVAFFLAGCAASPPPAATSPSATTSGSGAPFSVPAPDLEPGQSWVHALDVTGKITAGPFTAPIDEHVTIGGVILADGYRNGPRPALLGVDLGGPPDARGPRDMGAVGATLLEPQTLRGEGVDPDFLRPCQAEPAKCPTDLSAFLQGGGGSPDRGAGHYEFPLEPGKEWDSREAPEGVRGSMRVRVVGQETAQALGREVQVVRLDFAGKYTVDHTEDGVRITGTMDIDGTLAYSPELMAPVSQSAHEVDRFTLSQGGQSMRVDGDVRIAARLVAADLEAKPGLDAVELYEAFGLDGRSLAITAAKAGPGKVAVRIDARETPLEDVAWTLAGPDGAKMQEGRTREFELSLGPGVHRLHAEARHHGLLLVDADADLTAEGVVDGGGGGVPVEAKETVTCDLVVVNLPVGDPHGACPDVVLELGPGLGGIHASVTANSTFPAGAGRLQVLADGEVVAEAPTVDGKGSVAYAPDGGLGEGAWAVRYAPQAALQATAFIHAAAT